MGEINALFCATDTIAIGAIQYCRSQGLRVPEDVMVASVGDSRVGRVAYVPLTSAHLHYRTAGDKAARLLLDQLFSNTAYTFLPILIAFSAAKVFGSNPFLGVVIGMIMIHPNLQNAWTVASVGDSRVGRVAYVPLTSAHLHYRTAGDKAARLLLDQLFSNTAYTFLPILIAFSAAKVFGSNPFLGVVIGMIMIHPNLQNAWTVASEGVQTYQPVFGGLYSIPLVGYQGHVIPVIIAVGLMSQIEKRLHKVA